ncbi:DUF6185 family protein [Streptomyces sp. APSN-46.1]|uniref:DUF6185 family protein n=1 Tax=Streptomyces sp. APSN-46.1 TaxID=2929049 RepID=UPI001FB53F6A|nr:DUF6185 family protein [Streptomyces sp. APSN-46.1]MCJ1681005.1 DUF6185 family protein [Streptomyces sp. APSN-46.1]
MIRLRRSTLLLLHALLSALFAALTGMGIAHAAEAPQADPCRPDQLSGAKVTASAKFDHRGRDSSKLTSTMEIKIPATWGRASDLLLDTHSRHYRFALRCLLGKVSVDTFYDDEWRLKPLTVNADGKWITVHYEAVDWVQVLGTYLVGPWQLEAGKSEWKIQLTPPRNLAGATWDDVHVRLGGPGALSAAPPPTFGEEGTVLRWQHRKPSGVFKIDFRPPAPQHWAAITVSRGQFWENLGSYSASGVFWYIATSTLLFISVRRIRGGLGENLGPKEEESLKVMKSWAILQVILGLVVYMGDNVYDFLNHRLSWKRDYTPAVLLFSLMLLGIVLCFFGKVGKRLLIIVCTLTFCLAASYFVVELSESPLLPNSDTQISSPGALIAVLAYFVVIFVCCLGVVSAGQRVLLMGDRVLPQWVTVSVSFVVSASTLLWSYLAFERDWERTSWLAGPEWPEYGMQWAASYDDWWWSWFAVNTLEAVLTGASFLTSMALVGVLRVCRVERREDDSFTPNQAEKFLLVVLFAVAVVPGYGWYFGFSGYILTLVLGLVAAWSVLAFGYSKSVLEQPSADNDPLGKVISRTDRSDVLRLARHFRELQSQLQHLSAGSSSDRTLAQESIEREIDRMDRCLPAGVRPVDLPFACGPMATWWGNACRSALIACFIGLPATALMYWTETVHGESWVFITYNASGFLSIILDILFWHVTWVAGGFFLGALWRDLPGRHGPTKAFCVAIAFAIPVAVHRVIVETIGQGAQGTTSAIAAFVSVMTFTGFVMDVQTFQSERRYWPTNASLVMYVYQMRLASVAFFLAQLLALATIWRTIREGGPTAPPPSR